MRAKTAKRILTEEVRRSLDKARFQLDERLIAKADRHLTEIEEAAKNRDKWRTDLARPGEDSGDQLQRVTAELVYLESRVKSAKAELHLSG